MRRDRGPFLKPVLIMWIILFVGWMLLNAKYGKADSPCGPPSTWSAPQIAPPRVGIPDRVPLACQEIDGTLRCQ